MLAADVVVVAFGREDLLRRCLESLDADSSVLVVDNSSSSAVREVVQTAGATYIDAGRNAGFAAGVNIALRAGAGRLRDVLLLNPDALLTADDVARLIKWLEEPAQCDVGAASPRIVDAAGNPQRAVWPFPSVLGAWLEALGLARLIRQPEFVIGAALVIRKETLAAVGEFDERFFLYAEEADWQRRAREHGWRAAVCGDVVAMHVGAATSPEASRREALFHAGQETYIRKWFGAHGWFWYRLAVVIGAVGRAAVLRRPRRATAAHRAMIYLRGPRRCAGFPAGPG